MAEALDVHNNVLHSAIEANGGNIFKIVGDAFQDAIGRYREIGFTEFILFPPPDLSESSVFERVATEIIPELKKT